VFLSSEILTKTVFAYLMSLIGATCPTNGILFYLIPQYLVTSTSLAFLFSFIPLPFFIFDIFHSVTLSQGTFILLHNKIFLHNRIFLTESAASLDFKARDYMRYQLNRFLLCTHHFSLMQHHENNFNIFDRKRKL
jgi:hypothetical protein